MTEPADNNVPGGNTTSGDTASGDTTSGDEAAFAHYGSLLADAVEAALPAWVEDAVALRAGSGAVVANQVEIARAGQEAAAEVAGRLRELLVLDLDQQWTNPLTIVRTAARFPTAVLRSLGVPDVPRDQFAAKQDPDDVYDLTPAAFGDFGPEVHERGIMWGAAKAHLHLQRRRAEGHVPKSP